jgi:hypothetical protein
MARPDSAPADRHEPTPETAAIQPDRRTFLKQVCAGAVAAAAVTVPAASGSRAAAAPAFAGAAPAGPGVAAGPLPSVTIAGQRIPRMIIGSNPIGGWSHQIRNMTIAMTDYFNQENTTAFLRRCDKAGLTVFISPWQEKCLTALRTLWAEGSKMRTYFLGEFSRDLKLSKEILEYKPLWYIHHGNTTDALFRAGKAEQVHDFIKKVHDELGIPAGVSAHNPDCIKHAEDAGWEADVYQCCFYYLTRPKSEIRAKLGGAPLGEPFLDSDRETMVKVIQQVKKPCLAFKILGAGWHCENDQAVEDAFEYAFTHIKKTDAVLVGMWPKYKDEITQNVQLLQRYGAVA